MSYTYHQSVLRTKHIVSCKNAWVKRKNWACLLWDLWRLMQDAVFYSKFIYTQSDAPETREVAYVVVVESLIRVWVFVTLWTVTCLAPLSIGFPRQEYCRGLPFPSPGDLSDPEIQPMFSALAGGFFTTRPPGKPSWIFSSVQFRRSVVSDSLWPHES